MKDLLHELRQDYWFEAFRQGKRSGLIVDGLYDVNADKDLLFTYCGAPI